MPANKNKIILDNKRKEITFNERNTVGLDKNGIISVLSFCLISCFKQINM